MGNKRRGSKTHGKGHGKSHRGAGHRGGRGKTGRAKHKKSSGHKFGKYGFNRPPKLVTENEVINIGRIDEIAKHLVETGQATKEDDTITIDTTELGIDKVLGRGEINQNLKIIAENFSDSAIKKIEDAGGEVEEKQ
ncbi:uL15m family ribosomal protein [Methanonatronarchaeum sp. AMET-Sl]|uniref:uL15m family ribosomal protein n=1 Tax=Methanonatronarchaeum sp. AMET-Sl TaxID=3037654 RepID=UPI00244E2BA6|nr:uL15m family ribosomal protein [Methanonatronarchaeum sp. AMET-Sl]WGI17213.1 uL15 family ribosomal protein [Methanonatronarchaeum sp. AMET-Sl]